MKKLVKKLKFNFKADTFENPFQRTFYTNLEALVFEQEGETSEDTTMPDINFQDNKIQPFVDELTDIFGRDAASTKRPAPSKNGEPNAKVPKVSVNRDEIIPAISTNNSYSTSEGVTGLGNKTKPMLIEMVRSRCNI